MKISKNITISFTEDEVKEIIAEKCRTEGYTNIKAKDVILDVGTESNGFGTMEREMPIFKGCRVVSLGE